MFINLHKSTLSIEAAEKYIFIVDNTSNLTNSFDYRQNDTVQKETYNIHEIDNSKIQCRCDQYTMNGLPCQSYRNFLT